MNIVLPSNDIEEKVLKIIMENMENIKDSNNITSDMSLKYLGINSITFIKIVLTIETEFGFEFGDEDLDYNKFLTLKDLVKYIEQKGTDCK